MFCVRQSSVRGCRFSVMFVYCMIKCVKCSPVPASFFSMVLYIVSLLESFRLMYSTGRSSPFISWVRTAPSPRSDASVCSKKGREKSGECNSGPPHRAAFTWVKACWHCSVHGTVSASFSEVSQRAGELRIVRNKPPVIPRQPQELPHLLFGLGSRAGRNSCRLINLGTHLSVAQVETQITNLHPPNRTLLWVGR